MAETSGSSGTATTAGARTRQLGEAVTAMGTLRLTMSEARWIAAEQFGAAW